MLVSISEGFCLEGLLGAILFSELDILAAGVELGGCRRRGKFEEVQYWKLVVGPCLPVSEALVICSCSSVDKHGANEQQDTNDHEHFIFVSHVLARSRLFILQSSSTPCLSYQAFRALSFIFTPRNAI
jgi:hypothetical protein